MRLRPLPGQPDRLRAAGEVGGGTTARAFHAFPRALEVNPRCRDSIDAESTIVYERESKSRPTEGILTVDARAYNQRRERVLSYRRNLLVYKRTAETPYAKAGYA